MRPPYKRSSGYHRLSVADKQFQYRNRMSEPSTPCPVCETQLAVADLLAHLALRCPGRRAPHPRARWISWRGALALGVPRGTLHRWVAQGWVQVRRQDSGERSYLFREVVQRTAQLRTRMHRPPTTKRGKP